AADHQRLDVGRAQARFEIGADKGAVDPFDDHRLALELAGLVLDGIAGAIRQEGGIRTGALVANVKDWRAAVPEGAEQIDDPRHGLRIVAALARGLPLVEGALDVN